jgi:endonuclease/exonuclease/phosphatase family metal-dependent hydrolase
LRCELRVRSRFLSTLQILDPRFEIGVNAVRAVDERRIVPVAHTGTVRIATYNIRHAQGLDGRVSTARIAEVIRSLHADLVAVNEAWRVPIRFEQPRQLGELTGMTVAFQPVHHWGPVTQGNAILSAGPILGVQDLKLPRGLEHRGCLLVEAEVDGVRLRFGTLHLSLGRGHRTRQIALLAEALPTDLPLVLAGDFNGGVDDLDPLRDILTVVDDPPPTYSPGKPRKALDHVLFSEHWELQSLATVASRASDHLPLVAELRLR